MNFVCWAELISTVHSALSSCIYGQHCQRRIDQCPRCIWDTLSAVIQVRVQVLAMSAPTDAEAKQKQMEAKAIAQIANVSRLLRDAIAASIPGKLLTHQKHISRLLTRFSGTRAVSYDRNSW